MLTSPRQDPQVIYGSLLYNTITVELPWDPCPPSEGGGVLTPPWQNRHRCRHPYRSGYHVHCCFRLCYCPYCCDASTAIRRTSTLTVSVSGPACCDGSTVRSTPYEYYYFLLFHHPVFLAPEICECSFFTFTPLVQPSDINTPIPS